MKEIKLKDFVERFVPHNTYVKLFNHKIEKNEHGQLENTYELLWKGMDWQIAEDYSRSVYFQIHADVKPCPYADCNVISITSAGLSGDFTDEASLIIGEKLQ